MCAEQYNRLSPELFPSLHSLEKEPFFARGDKAGMPLFNEIFVFFYFHAFMKFTNMYAFLAIREGQSYNGLVARKHPDPACDYEVSDEFVITEHTIALMNLYVVCSLDPSTAMRRSKQEYYDKQVALLRAVTAAGRNWRAELAESLTKWHPTFQHCFNKRKLADIIPSVGAAYQVDPLDL